MITIPVWAFTLLCVFCAPVAICTIAFIVAFFMLAISSAKEAIDHHHRLKNMDERGYWE